MDSSVAGASGAASSAAGAASSATTSAAGASSTTSADGASSAATGAATGAAASVAFAAPPRRLRRVLPAFSADAANIVSLKSTNSMKQISALSPKRLPNLIIRVYPPGRFATFSETIENNSLIASLFCK